MVITDKHKRELSVILKADMKSKNLSQRKLERIIGISSTAINFVVNDKWDEHSMSDQQWIPIAKYLDYSLNDYGWKLNTNTRNMKVFWHVCRDAKGQLGDFIPKGFIITGPWGRGKSTALKYFHDKNPDNTYYLQCQSEWDFPIFLAQLKRSIGIGAKRDVGLGGQSPAEAVETIIYTLKSRAKNLMIIDEFNELPIKSRRFAKTFLNRLEGESGLILCGGENLEKQFKTGNKLATVSIQETFSRCGGEFIYTRDNKDEEIEEIIRLNGIEEPNVISKLIAQSHGDLRRVKRSVHKLRIAEDKVKVKDQLTIEDQNSTKEEREEEVLS